MKLYFKWYFVRRVFTEDSTALRYTGWTQVGQIVLRLVMGRLSTQVGQIVVRLVMGRLSTQVGQIVLRLDT